MALSDLFSALDFSDTEGPGCGQGEHEASCLCDVDLAAHPVGPNVTDVDWKRDVGYGVIGAKVAGPGASFVTWAAETLGAHDAVKAAGGTLQGGTERLEELRSTYLDRRTRNLGRYGGATVIRELLQLGWAFGTIANFLEQRPDEIVRQLTKRDAVDTEAYVQAEPMLRSGTPFPAVARATGLAYDSVLRLAEALGVKSLHAQGGGYKYPPETYERILALRAEGKSFTQIAEITGVKRNTCVGVVRRRTAAA